MAWALNRGDLAAFDLIQCESLGRGEEKCFGMIGPLCVHGLVNAGVGIVRDILSVVVIPKHTREITPKRRDRRGVKSREASSTGFRHEVRFVMLKLPAQAETGDDG